MFTMFTQQNSEQVCGQVNYDIRQGFFTLLLFNHFRLEIIIFNAEAIAVDFPRNNHGLLFM